MNIIKTVLDGVLLIEPGCLRDDRGLVFESYSKKCFCEHGLNLTFVQENHSLSHRGVLRGLHFQDMSAPQLRLVRCCVGEIWEVVVDLRVGSPTFGGWLGFSLSSANMRALLIGPEFAHGFVVRSEFAEVQYKCTRHDDPAAARLLAWDDPDVGISWPIKDPILSARDRNGPRLDDYLKDPAFDYEQSAHYSENPAFGSASWPNAVRASWLSHRNLARC